MASILTIKNYNSQLLSKPASIFFLINLITCLRLVIQRCARFLALILRRPSKFFLLACISSFPVLTQAGATYGTPLIVNAQIAASANDSLQQQTQQEKQPPLATEKTGSSQLVKLQKSGSNDAEEIDQINAQELLPSEINRRKQKLRQNPWLFLHPYLATYEIYSENDRLGVANRQLSDTDGLWQLKISTKLKKWLLTLKSNEYSNFKIQQQELLTQKFYSSTKISFKKARTIEQNFDWINRIETGKKNKKNWQLELSEQVFDRMSHILELRADLLRGEENFEYLVSYKGSRKLYQYTRAATEKLNTPLGELEVIRMNRISGDDSSFSIWLSPELNYFPVKIAQFEQDKPDVELRVKSLIFN